MTELIAFDIVITEKILVDAKPFLVYYAKAKGGTETKWMAVEDSEDPLSLTLHLPDHVEADYLASTGESFTPILRQLLLDEIKKKLARRK
jgi:hypothetical protein